MAIPMPTSILSFHRHHHHPSSPSPHVNGGYHSNSKLPPFPKSIATDGRAALGTQIPKPGFQIFQEVTNLCSQGELSQALQLLRTTPQNSDWRQCADAIGALLQACGQQKDIETGRQAHRMLSSWKEFRDNFVLNTRLMTMYSMCSSPWDARCVFDGLSERNLYQWNALISGYNRNEMWDEALRVFCELISTADLTPDNFTLPCVVKACSGLLSVDLGRAVHGLVVRLGLPSDPFVCNALIAMYGKCGFAQEAIRMFETMPERNLVSWNALICAFSENRLTEKSFDALIAIMAVDGLRPDDTTLVTILPVCAVEGELQMGRLVHGLAVKLGLSQEVMVNNALIDMYAKCGCPFEALHLFENAVHRNVVSWNAMIGACSREGDICGTFDLLRQMPNEGLKVDSITILTVLPACLEQSDLLGLKELHGYTIRNGFELEESVANTLIATYAKCGLLSYADHVFYGIENKNVSSWNAIIGGYAQNGDPSKAIDLFLKMTSLGLEPDWFSIGSMLLACANLKAVRDGKTIHGFVLRNGLETDSFIGISLLSLYVQCGKLSHARLLFNTMEDKNLVSWNSMIAGYSQNGQPDEALDLFHQMQQEGIQPYEIAMTCVFAACAQLSALRLGKGAHCFALKTNLSGDAFVGSSIIDMYAKCGSIEQSRRFFDRLGQKDAVSWTVMISGYGVHGHGQEAIEFFERMRMEGFKPDSFTFIGVLMACSHSGLVEEGMKYFEEMQEEHKIQARCEHYACVVDMLGRAGRLAEAVRLVEEMPEEPDAGIWGALLGACRIHGEVDIGERVASRLLKTEPEKAENYVLVSNLFAGSGMWEHARMVRGKMKEMGLKKDVGCSWIDVNGIVYKFISGDYSHPESKAIWEMWNALEEKICRHGYSPDTGSVLHELEDEEKVGILRGHSEKLAIAFGLLKTTKGVTLRVSKNLRICRDCHNAAKLVSKVAEREIIVRDNKRFHHFKDGLCSCGDYW
ncbi:hypothetical protein ACLOJK_007256 [Asimina triloba]